MRTSFHSRFSSVPAAQQSGGSMPTASASRYRSEHADDRGGNGEVAFGAFPRRTQVKAVLDLAWCEALEANRRVLTVRPRKLNDRWTRRGFF